VTEGNIPKSKQSFAKDAFAIFSGTALSQLIAILATPIVTRFFVPEVFGIAAVFTAITGILSVIVCMRYELSIVLPKNDKDAVALFWISIFFTLIVSSITLILTLLLGAKISVWLNVPTLKKYLWLIPVYTLFFGIFTSLNFWNTRTRKFKRLALAQVNSSLATSASKIGVGAAGYTMAGGLIGSDVFGKFIATFVLGWQIWRDDGIFLLKSFQLKRIKTNLFEYKRMALVNMPASVLNTISQKLPAFLLAFFFSPAIVGFYALTYRLLKLPSQLVGESVRKVFFQRASSAYNETGNIKEIVGSTFGHMLNIALGPFVVLFILSPYIFGFFFGEEWYDAGVYARWLIPWVFTGFLVTPMSSVITVSGKEIVGFKFQAYLLSSRIIAFLIGGLIFKDPLITIIIYSAIGVFFQLYMLRWILNEAKAKFNKLHLKRMVLIVTALVLSLIFILELFKISNQILIYAITFVYFLFYLISFKNDVAILLNKLFKNNQTFKKNE